MSLMDSFYLNRRYSILSDLIETFPFPGAFVSPKECANSFGPGVYRIRQVLPSASANFNLREVVSLSPLGETIRDMNLFGFDTGAFLMQFDDDGKPRMNKYGEVVASSSFGWISAAGQIAETYTAILPATLLLAAMNYYVETPTHLHRLNRSDRTTYTGQAQYVFERAVMSLGDRKRLLPQMLNALVFNSICHLFRYAHSGTGDFIHSSQVQAMKLMAFTGVPLLSLSLFLEVPINRSRSLTGQARSAVGKMLHAYSKPTLQAQRLVDLFLVLSKDFFKEPATPFGLIRSTKIRQTAIEVIAIIRNRTKGQSHRKINGTSQTSKSDFNILSEAIRKFNSYMGDGTRDNLTEWLKSIEDLSAESGSAKVKFKPAVLAEFDSESTLSYLKSQFLLYSAVALYNLCFLALYLLLVHNRNDTSA
jgi:hypothetical protein